MAISTASSTLPVLQAEPEGLARVLQIGAVLGAEARRQPPVEPRRRADPVPHVAPVPLEGRRRLARLLQTVPREHPDRLEQPVAARAGQAHDEALVDQLAEHGDGRVRPAAEGPTPSTASTSNDDGNTLRCRSRHCSVGSRSR